MDAYSYVQRIMERQLLRRYVPPWIVINERGEIGNFCGDIETFIAPIQSAETRNVFDLALEGVRNTLEHVQRLIEDDRHLMPPEGVRIAVENCQSGLTIVVFPVEGKEPNVRWYCIVFESGRAGNSLD